MSTAAVPSTQLPNHRALLVSLAGRTIDSRTDLFEILRQPLIGVPTTAVVERSGEILTIGLLLEA